MAKPSKLTPKQEAFARAYFETGNAAEAYRRAYDVDENARDQWFYVEACQLLDHPKVAQRVKELRKAAAAHEIYTRQTALNELEDARQLAMREAQSSAAVSAVQAKLKVLGMDKPDRLEVSGPDGKPVKVHTITRTIVDPAASDG